MNLNSSYLVGLCSMPISHFLVRPRRAAAVRTNAAIDASLRGDNVRR